MTAPITPAPIHDSDIEDDLAGFIDSAVENTPTGPKALKIIVATLLTGLVQLIVSVARRPVTLIVNQVVASRADMYVQQVKAELRQDTAFLDEVRLSLDYDATQLVKREVESQMADNKQALLAVIAQENINRQEIIDRAVAEALAARQSRRVYFFAPLLAFIGGLLGGLGFWGVTSRFQSGTVTDAAGQEWVATSILTDPVFIALFVAIGFFLFAGIGAGIGLAIDIVRDRRR